MQQPTNCLRVFDHFVVLVLKGLYLFRRCEVVRYNNYDPASFLYICLGQPLKIPNDMICLNFLQNIKFFTASTFLILSS